MKTPLGIIPSPQFCELRSDSWILDSKSSIGFIGISSQPVAELLAEYLRPATGFKLPVQKGSGEIVLEQTANLKPDDAGFLPEDYELEVSSKGVKISATSAAGLARGVQALRQIFPPEILSSKLQKDFRWELPCLQIKDKPRFRWRGLHFDVSRHFYGVDDVCRFIDLLALHRMNVFHWHLTDDQGWRLEIPKYPKLTELGGWRDETLIGHNNKDNKRYEGRYDGKRYGGFYTHADIRKVLAYAEARYVTVIPEVDLPGHMQAAIAAYPELGNGKDIKVRTHWGVSDHVLRPIPVTLDFLKEILTVVLDLFPGRFIHVGGDEVPTKEWEGNSEAQAQLAKIGGSKASDLHAWFIREMTQFIMECGRRVIGWDEVEEVGLSHGVAIMSWRGEKGGIAAANAGHEVVMTPYSHTYFDFYQAEPVEKERLAIGGMVPTEKVYSYEPIPAELDSSKHHLVMGSQGQLWTEYIADRDHLDAMAYPRACALAEVLWISKEEKNWNDFCKRLEHHRKRLDVLGVKAHSKP